MASRWYARRRRWALPRTAAGAAAYPSHAHAPRLHRRRPHHRPPLTVVDGDLVPRPAWSPVRRPLPAAAPVGSRRSARPLSGPVTRARCPAVVGRALNDGGFGLVVRRVWLA